MNRVERGLTKQLASTTVAPQLNAAVSMNTCPARSSVIQAPGDRVAKKSTAKPLSAKRLHPDQAGVVANRKAAARRSMAADYHSATLCQGKPIVNGQMLPQETQRA
jgi:hypothetical protein